MTKRARILVLGLESEAGPACLAQAASRGIDIVAADREDKLDTIDSWSGSAPPVARVALDFRDPMAALAAAQPAHTAEPFDGVFTYREFGLESAATIAAALGLPGNPPEVVRATRNKARLKALLRGAGLPQPPSFTCQSVDEAVDVYHRAPRGRWIVKPCSQSGSMGVHLVDGEDDLRRAAAAILQLGEREGMLLEAFIEGPEFSVEGMVDQGRTHIFAITEKTLFGGGSFVERGHVLPAPLPAQDVHAIRDVTSRALAAAGVRMGHFHVEVFLTASGVIVGELHTRVGGDWIDLLVEQALDIEIYGLAFEQMLGRPLDFDALRPARAAGVRFLRQSPGIVRSVAGIEEAGHIEGLVRIDIGLKPGDVIPLLSSSFTRAGSFVVRGNHTEEVKRRLDEIERNIRIETVPDHGAHTDN